MTACRVCGCPAHGALGFPSDPRLGLPDALRGLMRPTCGAAPCDAELAARAGSAARAFNLSPDALRLVRETTFQPEIRP